MFDLAAYQQKAQEMVSPKLLFYLWEDVCRRYDHGELSQLEFEEMKGSIYPMLNRLASVRSLIDGMAKCA